MKKVQRRHSVHLNVKLCYFCLGEKIKLSYFKFFFLGNVLKNNRKNSQSTFRSFERLSKEWHSSVKNILKLSKLFFSQGLTGKSYFCCWCSKVALFYQKCSGSSPSVGFSERKLQAALVIHRGYIPRISGKYQNRK